MTTELTVADRRYEALVEKFVANYHRAEADNLKRYHMLGELYIEFHKGLESNKYGNATVEKLAEDLCNRGFLTAVADVRRFLYWAKNLAETFPDVAELEKLAGRGFTVTHAKPLFAENEQVRRLVLEQMFDESGKIVPSREMSTLVKSISKGVTMDAAGKAVEDHRRATAATPDVGSPDELVQPTVPEAAKHSEPEDQGEGDEGEEEPETPGNPPLDTPKPSRPEGVPATGGATNKEFTVSPVKALAALEKTLLKVAEAIPDGLIGFREGVQIGYDSDAAFKKFNDQVRQTLDSIHSLAKPLDEIRKELTGHLESGAG